MAAEGHPVEVCCRVLQVSVSGYYAWRNRPPSQRSLRHVWVTEQIRAVHTASHGTYGSRRVHAELRLGRGVLVGYHAVGMLMRRADIRGLPGSRRPRPKHQTPTAADLVNRDFACDAPNQLWVTVPSPAARCASHREGMWSTPTRSCAAAADTLRFAVRPRVAATMPDWVSAAAGCEQSTNVPLHTRLA